ncbi:GDYXXLXY protein [Leptospira wolbachii serovar Codice str. CDC]|uniref:GDYXXLXY protein n=1 Tax=Leptospira wolbachii serovar Codice str. CDC TaxID=1218599 RepID=R9A7Y1_9LEPT|nr:GDYXXLXY domain-containing protein [Leptospira wolbachii]EOQ98222.1 GDYXXLXY protein [Leptospira wolbachii serovar Codice str. CDC]
MKEKITVLLTINLLLLFGFLTQAVIKKETIRNNGRLVFLPLLPKDPRSLFQGDYMILNYDWSLLEREENAKAPNRGCLVFQIQEDVLMPVRLQSSFTDLKVSEFCLQYYRSDYDLKIGAESYFFQEGDGDLYSEAKYAGIRFREGNTDGDKLLIGLYDQNKQRLGSKDQR